MATAQDFENNSLIKYYTETINKKETIVLRDTINPNNIAPFRVIDGIHDFYETLDKYTANNVLSIHYNINSLSLYNNNNVLGLYDVKKTSPTTLKSLINMSNNDISSEMNLKLCKNDINQCINFTAPIKLPSINYSTLLNNPEIVDTIIQTLPLEGNYILSISGNKEEILQDVSENKFINKLILYPNTDIDNPNEYYTQDASKLPKEYFKLLYNGLNNQAKSGSQSFLSNLIDPASIKDYQRSENIMYTILYTYINNNPIYCNITKISNNTFSIKFIGNNNNSAQAPRESLFEFNTGPQKLSPGIDKISEYINDKILRDPIKSLTSRTSGAKKAGVRILDSKNNSNEDINPKNNNIYSLTIEELKKENSIDWSLLFELIISKINEINNINNDPTIKTNSLISFKTIGDQMYFYDACMLKHLSETENIVKKATLISTDGFLVDYAINRQELDVFYSSGKNGKRNIIFYKAPIDIDKYKDLRNKKQEQIQQNFQMIEAIKERCYVKLSDLKERMDNYKKIFDTIFNGITIKSQDRRTHIYKINMYDTLSISYILLTLLFYSVWKLFLIYLSILNLTYTKLYKQKLEPTNKDLLDFLNIESEIDSFTELLATLNYDTYDNMYLSVFSILNLENNTTNLLKELIKNIAGYIEFADGNTLPVYGIDNDDLVLQLNICSEEVLEELNTVYKTIKISDFNYNAYLIKVKAYTSFNLWYKSAYSSFESFYKNYITKYITKNKIEQNRVNYKEEVINVLGEKRNIEEEKEVEVAEKKFKKEGEYEGEGGGLNDSIKEIQKKTYVENFEQFKLIFNELIEEKYNSENDFLTYLLNVSNFIETINSLELIIFGNNKTGYIDVKYQYFNNYLNNNKELLDKINIINNNYDKIFEKEYKLNIINNNIINIEPLNTGSKDEEYLTPTGNKNSDYNLFLAPGSPDSLTTLDSQSSYENINSESDIESDIEFNESQKYLTPEKTKNFNMQGSPYGVANFISPNKGGSKTKKVKKVKKKYLTKRKQNINKKYSKKTKINKRNKNKNKKISRKR